MVDQTRKAATKVRRDAGQASPLPLSALPVDEEEIAAVEAFLGLHFATIFEDACSEQKPRKCGASGGPL